MMRRKLRGASSFGYGFVAQGCSSARNFGLVVVAGHVIGSSGVGTMFVGFSTYLLLLSLERALVTDPLVATSSARDPTERQSSARFAITLVFIAAIPTSVSLTAIGIALPAKFGLGMLLFAPWIGAALIQELGRSILFRDRRGPSVAISDATWLVTMLATAPIAFVTRSDWAVIGCWGAGALTGAAVVLVQLRWRPSSWAYALMWWKAEARQFGQWLGMHSVLDSAASYTCVFALVGILGASDYGGLRAVQSVFTPLTLIGPAIALPGFPLVSRVIGSSARHALAIAGRLAGVITLVTGVYVVVFWSFPSLLAFSFGPEFVDFQSIIAPIGVGQLLAAPAFGLVLFLKAAQRGRTIFALGTLNAFLSLTFSITLGFFFGLSGAAWSGAAVGALGGIALIAVLRRSMRSHNASASLAPRVQVT